jgi:ATP-dependent protease Clp ATPase subunit
VPNAAPHSSRHDQVLFICDGAFVGVENITAKLALALGVSNAFRYVVGIRNRDDPDPIVADADLHNVRIEKSDALVIGPLGPQDRTGQVTSFLHQCPLVISDATSLTDAGYIDDDENLLVSLIRAGNDDLNRPRSYRLRRRDQEGAGGSGFKDMSLVGSRNAPKYGRHGATICWLQSPSTARNSVRHDRGPAHLRRAFVAIEDIIAKSLGRGGFGFDRLSDNYQVFAHGLLKRVKPEALVTFGLISELPGKRAKDMQSRSTVIVARLSGKSLFVPSKP